MGDGIHFPHKESSKYYKLSRPWHGPYRIISCNNPDITAVKIFFDEELTVLEQQSYSVHSHHSRQLKVTNYAQNEYLFMCYLYEEILC